MKNTIKYILQKLLGYATYLYVFARFKIRTLKYDRKERDFFYFLKLIPSKKGAILDIGANIGIMTVHLSRQFQQNTIHAIEPIPSNVDVLQKVKTRYHLSNVVIHALALGEDDSIAKMILPCEKKVYFQGLSHVKHETINYLNEGKEFEVSMKRLDNLFPDEEIIALKIDVENFEYFVLKGGEAILKKYQPLIYAELWDNENRTKCFELLHSFHYKVFIVENQQLIPYDSERHQKQNFIFIV